MERYASEHLAEFARAAMAERPGDAVARKVATHALDTLGICAAAAGQDFAPAARAVAEGLAGPAEATGISLASRLSAPNAALLNGILAHGLDYDDTHLGAIVHPSATVVTATLAVAEEIDASGPRWVQAAAIGLEAAVRIGLAARGAFHDRGFHPTGICGTFGAALAAGALYGLEQEKIVASLGLAASMAGGLLEFLTDGTSAKRLHGGWAAHSGIVATRLARAGLSGPVGGIDGRFGVLRAMLGDAADPALIAAELGQRWEMLDIALKPYPCCHFLHAFLDAGLELRAALGWDGGARSPVLTNAAERAAAERESFDRALATITRVECAIAAREVPVVCEPLATKRRPQTPYDAQFSLPFALATLLVRGRLTLADFSEESIRDDRLLALAERIEYQPDPNADYPRRFPGRVRLTSSDGRVLTAERADNRGGPTDPLPRAEVEAKFAANATPLLDRDGVAVVIDSFAAGEAPGARALMAHFARAVPA